MINKVKTKFNDLSIAISEGLFGGEGKKAKIEPKDFIPLPDKKDIDEALTSLEQSIVDRAGQSLIKVGQELPEVADKLSKISVPIVYNAGRRIGMAFGDGIAIAMEDVKSLIESFRDILTTSITGVFESLGKFAVNQNAEEFKNNILGVLGSAFTAIGSAVIAFGTAMLNFNAAATTFNAPAVILAGGAMVALGSAISATARREFGGATGTAASSQFIGSQLTGQSSFGQVLVAEVDYDKLRFVLNNGNSSSFRSNG
jgi:hypothetical protein